MRRGACAASALCDTGRPAAAFSNLTYLLDQYILPNTFYHEGENGECGETPPAASSAIQDWMLMEDDGILNIFAGISDDDLTDAAFYQLRGPGAFLVSAARKHGVTQFVSVTSEEGAPLAVATDLARPLGTLPAGVPLHEQPGGSVAIELAAGATVTLYSAAGGRSPPDLTITPSAGNVSQANSWGWPSFHGIPPPPPPTPPPAPCPAALHVTGYTCHLNKCGDDAFKVRAQCGTDLCWPQVSNASLCQALPGKNGSPAAVGAAAARCTAFGHGCKSFGMTPDGIWPGADVCGNTPGVSTCSKFFSNSGNNFLIPATDWVMWTKDA